MSAAAARRRVFYPLAYIDGVVAYTFEVFRYHHKQYRLIGVFRVLFDEFDEV